MMHWLSTTHELAIEMHACRLVEKSQTADSQETQDVQGPVTLTRLQLHKTARRLQANGAP